MPDVQDIIERLSYEPDTGILRWKIDITSGVHGKIIKATTGTQAGSVKKSGYRMIRVLGNMVLAHRAAFVIMTGGWPQCEMDHIDGARDNNRWNNLRLATTAQNRQNRAYRPNACGRLGATYVPRIGKYQSTIKCGGKAYYLGIFDTADAAGDAYDSAAAKMFGEFRRLA